MDVSFIREAFIAVNIRGSWVNKRGKELPGISHRQQTFPQTIFKAIQKAIFRQKLRIHKKRKKNGKKNK